MKMQKVGRRSFGFTLLEILVVLAIVGLLAGVAVPRLQRIADSVDIRNQETDIKLTIEGLGYKAYVSGKPIVLANEILAKDAGNPDIPLKVPLGWQLQIQQPIRFAINGVCGGGSLSLIDPRKIRETFQLRPPKCRLESIDNSG